MATGKQVEQLQQQVAAGVPQRARDNLKAGFSAAGKGLTDLGTTKTLLDTVVDDAAAAGEVEYALNAIRRDWAANVQTALTAEWSYSGKTGINALAQLMADLSEQAGLEGGPAEMRLYKNGVVVPVSQDV